MHLVDTLGPIFLMTALGYVLFRTGFFLRELIPALNAITYWVALPALLFHSVATARTGGGGAGRLFALLLATTLASLALGYAVCRLLRLRRQQHGTFVQAAFRGNLAYIGLPVLLYSMPPGAGAENLRTLVILAMAPTIVLYNILAVVVLLASAENRESGPWPAIRGAMGNPLLLGVLAGLLVRFSGLPLPLVLDRTLDALGQPALPMALICVGGSLATVHLRGSRRNAVAAALLKVAVAPLICLLLLPVAGLGPEASKAALVLMATPTAVASYTMAVQMGGDEALASSSVVLSTLLSGVSLSVILLTM